MASGFWTPICIGVNDGATITAIGAASAIPSTAKYTFPPNSISVGTAIRVTAQGRISCVVTTPGTARFDLRLNNLVIYDSGPLSLNVVAKTTLPWWFDAMVVCRTPGGVGTATFFGFGKWTCEAYINTAVATTGPAPGSVISSVSGGPETAPATTALADTTVSNPFDFQFTQTVSTGSFTCHNFVAETGSIFLN